MLVALNLDLGLLAFWCVKFGTVWAVGFCASRVDKLPCNPSVVFACGFWKNRRIGVRASHMSLFSEPPNSSHIMPHNAQLKTLNFWAMLSPHSHTQDSMLALQHESLPHFLENHLAEGARKNRLVIQHIPLKRFDFTWNPMLLLFLDPDRFVVPFFLRRGTSQENTSPYPHH